MYVNGILTQLQDLMRFIGHSCHFINEDFNIDFFSQKGHHMSDDRTDINFLSVNVRGLRNYVKRRKVFNWVHKHNGAKVYALFKKPTQIIKLKNLGNTYGEENPFSHMGPQKVVELQH